MAEATGTQYADTAFGTNQPTSSNQTAQSSAPMSGPIGTDGDHTSTTNQQGSRGAIAVGETSAKTSMGGGGGGSGGGGGGGSGGGGGGGGSYGASLAAGPDITSSGLNGDTKQGTNSWAGFGDFNFAPGSAGFSTGMKASTMLAAAGGVLAVGIVAWLMLRRKG